MKRSLVLVVVCLLLQGNTCTEGPKNWLVTVVKLGIIALAGIQQSAFIENENPLISSDAQSSLALALTPDVQVTGGQVSPYNPLKRSGYSYGTIGNDSPHEELTIPFLAPLPEEQLVWKTTVAGLEIAPEDVQAEPPGLELVPGITDVVPADLVMAQIGAVFSRAAYEYDRSNPEGVRDFVQHALPNIKITEAIAFDKRDTFMFFVKFQNPQTQQNAAALVFRGTANWGNWRSNLRAMFRTDDRTTASGLFSSYKSLQKNVKGLLRELIIQKEDKLDSIGKSRLTLEASFPGGFFVFGHSLGGAMASYAANDIATLYKAHFSAGFDPDWLQVMTYGQPREYTSVKDKNEEFRKFRFVIEGDPVPSLPLASETIVQSSFVDEIDPPPAFSLPIERYTHFGDAYFLHKDGKTGNFAATEVATDFAASDAPKFLQHVLSGPAQAHSMTHYIEAFDDLLHTPAINHLVADDAREILASTGLAVKVWPLEREFGRVRDMERPATRVLV